jgi:phage-related protein
MADSGLIIPSQSNFDIGTIDAFVSEPGNWRSSPPSEWNVSQPAARRSHLLSSRQPQISGRKLSYRLGIVSADVATLQSNRDELEWRLSQADVQLAFSDDTTRVYIGSELSEFAVEGIQPEFLQPAYLIRVSHILEIPYLQDATEQVVGFTTATDMPTGIKTVLPVVRLTGAFSSGTTIVQKDYNAVTIRTVTINAGFGAGEWVELDSFAQTVLDDSSVNRAADVDGGFFMYEGLTHADYPNSNWLTMEASAGTGQSTHRRTW